MATPAQMSPFQRRRSTLHRGLVKICSSCRGNSLSIEAELWRGVMSEHLEATCLNSFELMMERSILCMYERMGKGFMLILRNRYAIKLTVEGIYYRRILCILLQKWRYFPDTWNERGSFLPINYDPYNVREFYSPPPQPSPLFSLILVSSITLICTLLF